MKRLVIIFMLVGIAIPAFNQDTTFNDNNNIKLVDIVEEDGITKVLVNNEEIIHLEDIEDGVQIHVFDDDLVYILHEENRVILQLRRDEISDMLDEDPRYSQEDINLAIGEINETLLKRLEDSNIDEDEVDIEIDDEEVHFDIEDNGILEIKEYDDGVKINIREKPLLDIEEDHDTTKIRIGNKGIKIIEDEDGTSVKVLDDDDMEVHKRDKKDRAGKKYKGHWAGLELGLNNFVNNDFSISRDENNDFMDLNTGRSINVNINFLQYNVGLGTEKAGLTTGMGIEFSNYFFDNNNNIATDPETGIVYEVDYTDLGINLSKSKLTTTYLTVPLFFEAQIGGERRSKRVHVSAGLIGALKIGSHTKVVYKESGSKQKDKNRGDFNLNSLRYGVTARVGYQALNLYANYYITPFFEDGKGPELYPISVGFAIMF